jgi:hypothetical protein
MNATMDEVVNATSRESIELAKETPVVELPVVETAEQKPVEAQAEPVKAEGTEEAKTDEPKTEEENSVIRQMRKQLRQQQKQISELRQAQVQVQPEPEPTRDNFNSEEAFIDARVDYKLKQTQQVIPKTPDVFETKFEETIKTHSDFKDALEDIDHVMFTPDAQQSIRQAVETLPYGGDVLYHLAKNPALAEELALLPPAAFAARLGDIHGSIRQAKTVKQVSKAPAPITPVSGSAKVEKSYDDMDQAEFMAARRREKEAYRKSRFGI